MKQFIFIALSIISISCRSQEHTQRIQKISFYPIEMNLANPNEFPSQLSVIEVTDNKIYQVLEKYNNESLISSDTIKSIYNDFHIAKIIEDIPLSYFESDTSFGNINVADEGALGVTIQLKSNKQVFWKIGILDDQDDKGIKSLLAAFLKIRSKLDK